MKKEKRIKITFPKETSCYEVLERIQEEVHGKDYVILEVKPTYVLIKVYE